MKRHIPWPSIGQYREVVKNVQHRAHYKGRDENGEVIYDTTAKSPTLTFEGTCKLHGTNAAVAISPNCDIWYQSRENIITPEKDNAGFAMWAYGREQLWLDIATDVVTGYYDGFNTTFKTADNFTHDKDLLIFGEWCGGNIQNTVALNQLQKMFVIFGIALVDSEGQKTYLTRSQIEEVVGWSKWGTGDFNPATRGIDGERVFSIYDFQTWQVDIDFENPHHAQNQLSELTLAVEAECPVGKAFGVTPEKGPIIGEGIVWRCITPGWEDSGYWFKTKGLLHGGKGSKSKTLSAVDVERIDNIKELAIQLTPEWRLDQMLTETFNLLNGGEIDIKGTGEYIKAVMRDILKECLPEISASGFTTKDITSAISKIARDFLIKRLEV